MHVLVVIDTLAVGGAERSTLEILKRISPRCRITVATLYGGGPLVEECRRQVQQLVVHDLRTKYGFLQGRRYVRALVRELQPDLVHSILFRADIICRLALLGQSIPLVNSFVNDSYSPLRYRLKESVLGRTKLAGIQFIDWLTKARADHFTAITESTKQQNAKDLRIPPKNISVIYRGRAIPPTDELKNTDKVESQPLTFISTSRLIWRKGYREALYAIAHMSYPRVRYLIAGDGVDGEAIRAFAESLPNSDRFKFLGEVSDLTSLYRQADFFLMASHYEGLGGSLIEAMLQRIPVIASDIEVFREVTDNHALFFEVREKESLLDVLDELRSPAAYREMVEGAYQLARTRYDIDHVADQTFDLYSTLSSTNR